jgi:hypothetical protein
MLNRRFPGFVNISKGVIFEAEIKTLITSQKETRFFPSFMRWAFAPIQAEIVDTNLVMATILLTTNNT